MHSFFYLANNHHYATQNRVERIYINNQQVVFLKIKLTNRFKSVNTTVLRRPRNETEYTQTHDNVSVAINYGHNRQNPKSQTSSDCSNGEMAFNLNISFSSPKKQSQYNAIECANVTQANVLKTISS